jgi:hypothetical protein
MATETATEDAGGRPPVSRETTATTATHQLSHQRRTVVHNLPRCGGAGVIPAP